MSGADWLSYSLQDFIMFGPQVFLRLFVRINEDWWPWPLLAVLVGLAVPVLLYSRRILVKRLALGLVALAWIASGYGFLVEYFGPINLPAEWFGWAFVAQGGLLGLVAVFSAHVATRAQHGSIVILWTLGVLGLPWLTVAETGQWQAVALFGMAPGTTVAVSVLAIGSLPGPWRWICLVLPLTWSLFSAVTYWGLETRWLLGFPVATLIFIGLGFWLSPSRAQSRG